MKLGCKYKRINIQVPIKEYELLLVLCRENKYLKPTTMAYRYFSERLSEEADRSKSVKEFIAGGKQTKLL